MCAWGKQPHTDPTPPPRGAKARARSAEPSTRVARTSADATAPARPECRRPSWTLRGHPREAPCFSGRYERAGECESHAQRCVCLASRQDDAASPPTASSRRDTLSRRPAAGAPVPTGFPPAHVSAEPWWRARTIRRSGTDCASVTAPTRLTQTGAFAPAGSSPDVSPRQSLLGS
jgi:hypothetical protein